MPSPLALSRWSVPVLLLAVGLIVLLTHLTHSERRAESPVAPSVAVPTEGPSAAAIAELQARNKGLHWIAVNARTALVVAPAGSCGTLTEIGPAQISFHTGRESDPELHLFSSWSDAYTAAEGFCQSWATHQPAR